VKFAGFPLAALRKKAVVRSRSESRVLFGKVIIAIWLGVSFVQTVCAWSNPSGIDQVDAGGTGRRLTPPVATGFDPL